MSEVSPVLARAKPAKRFTQAESDLAFRVELEKYVAWAIELLDPAPSVIDSAAIRHTRTEAAVAVLNALWAVMAEKNRQEDEPCPLPGLVWHLSPPLEERRLQRARRSE